MGVPSPIGGVPLTQCDPPSASTPNGARYKGPNGEEAEEGRGGGAAGVLNELTIGVLGGESLGNVLLVVE